VEVVALDDGLGRRAEMLLGRTKTTDVTDAAIALLARDGDEILTEDTDDIRPLVEAVGVHVEVIEV
jgi:hypothetical protein